MKHTPGPWSFEESQTGPLYITSEQGDVARICDDTPGIDIEAQDFNAALIAAAPDMFNAIKFLVESFPELSTDEELSGADVIEHLANHWDMITNTIKKIVQAGRDQ